MRLLCFFALPHHMRTMQPVLDNLRERGWEIHYFTAPAEAVFEITGHDQGLTFMHSMDLLTLADYPQIIMDYQSVIKQWQPAVKSCPSLHYCPLPVQDKLIYWAVESYRGMLRLVEAIKPNLILALHELTSWGKILGYLAKQYSIPYITLQEGMYYCHPHYYCSIAEYSRVMVWGEGTKDVLVQAGNPPENIYPIGHLYLDDALSAHAPYKAYQKSLPHLVSCFFTYANYKNIALPNLSEWSKKRGDIEIVFKWHPLYSEKDVQKLIEQFPEFKHMHGSDPYGLIAASDACIVIGSTTVGIEALYAGKPLGEIRLEPRYQLYSFVEHGVADDLTNCSDFGAWVERCLAGKRDNADAVNKYLNYHFAYRDCRAAERVSDLVSIVGSET